MLALGLPVQRGQLALDHETKWADLRVAADRPALSRVNDLTVELDDPLE
jgi:hypothetical protein